MEYMDEGGIGSLLYDTEIRRRHTRNFRRTFERLLALGRGCDVDGIIVDSMKQSAFGLLYEQMSAYMPGDFDAADAEGTADQSGASSTSTSSKSA